MPTTSNYQENTARADEFVRWFGSVKGRAPTSIEGYQQTLRLWIDHCGSTTFGDVSPELVEAFTLRPRRSGNVGRPATRRRDLAVVASFYKWLCATDPSCRNPTVLVGTPTVHNRKPKALDDDVWRLVWRTALPVERAWLGLGFFTGLRSAELTRVAVGHYDSRGHRVVGFVRKGGDEDDVMCGQMSALFHARLRPLLPNVDEWLGPLSTLAEARNEDETLIPWYDGPWTAAAGDRRRFGLVGGDVAPTVAKRRLVRVLKRAGLHPDLFTPHALRHSFVANCLRMGIPLHIVQRLANHSSPAVTQRYGRATEQILNEWLGNQ